MLIRRFADKNPILLYDLRKTWVKKDEVSQHLILTVCMAEDVTFFSHNGVSFSSLVLALEKDLAGKKTPGYSTITQQTAKNLFLFPKRSYFRKAIEVYYALLMEVMWGKDRILEVYLNIIELGEGIFGIEKGAQNWFQKSAKDLCFDESCLLVTILNQPRKLSPLKPEGIVMLKASHFYKKGYRKAASFKNAPPVHSEKQLFQIV